MAQTKNPRRVEATEARAKLVNVRISPQKLNLVAASIRGLPVQKALNELEFSHKRIVGDLERREQPQPRHRQPGCRRGLRGQEPGDEAFREPRSRSLLAHPETL
jgi:ribosomal protein L22